MPANIIVHVGAPGSRSIGWFDGNPATPENVRTLRNADRLDGVNYSIGVVVPERRKRGDPALVATLKKVKKQVGFVIVAPTDLGIDTESKAYEALVKAGAPRGSVYNFLHADRRAHEVVDRAIQQAGGTP